MSKKKNNLRQPGGVKMSLWLTHEQYAALQRWKGERDISASRAIVLGLERLPGMTALIKDEEEAYATKINQELEQKQAITEAARRA